MTVDSHAWFGRKRIGWGFGPRSWQGWLTVFVYSLSMITLPAYFGPQLGDQGVRLIWGGLTILFVVLFVWKLERPKRD